MNIENEEFDFDIFIHGVVDDVQSLQKKGQTIYLNHTGRFNVNGNHRIGLEKEEVRKVKLFLKVKTSELYRDKMITSRDCNK